MAIKVKNKYQTYINAAMQYDLYSAFLNRLPVVILFVGLFFQYNVNCTDPKFDPSTLMRLVLVPADAQIGSVIYRLRATDEEFDYPLTFEIVKNTSIPAIKIETLPCTKYNSVCQANVLLQRRLESGRYYDFHVAVKDTKGGVTVQLCSITATNFSTPHETIFPHKPGIILVPENARRGTELDYVIARKNPLFQKPVYLELWGSPLFAIRQKIISADTTEGTIFLLGPLDFEKQAMFHITILANDAYAEPGQDSRNIAGIEIVIIVQDVQDQPPVFVVAPPVTKLQPGLLPGDKILKVHAEDGDKGNPREIRYGLVSENNPFTSFFDINDTSGEIFLMRPLEDIAALTHIGDPVLLTVIAEEVKIGKDEPAAMSSTIQLAFFLPERSNTAPYFENDHYVTRIDENPPQGSTLSFPDPYVPRVYDDDVGKNGVFSLTLVNNNGTFEISPNVAERSTTFLITVRDNILLDYEERQYVQFQILAQELGPVTNLSAIVNVTVYLNDVNDNSPVFEQQLYSIEIPENITAGTKIIQVHASDLDTSELGGKIKYTAILGFLNTSLNLNSENGMISITKNNHGFDRETMPEYHLYVEARDNDGLGNRVQVPLIIKVIDINDETPQFEKDIYEFILSPALDSFTQQAFLHANDKDATAPNNEVRYEIINGNYENKFFIDKITGELTLQEKIKYYPKDHGKNFQQEQEARFSTNHEINLFVLIARAYDLGVPVRYNTTTVHIYPPESRSRAFTFVVPGLFPNKKETEATLSAITGGKVIIHDIRPLKQSEENSNKESTPRSVVTAIVLYDASSVVDVYQIQQRLLEKNSSFSIMNKESRTTDTLYKAENKLLFWLLIMLAALVALTVLILLLCCICSWCPLYGASSKRIVNISRTEDDVHLVHREKANGKQTKSVQVTDWVGRRDAWSSDKITDSRTKPTRWEFHNANEQRCENLIENSENIHESNEINKSLKMLSGRDEKIINFSNKHGAKETETNFHSSQTHLVKNNEISLDDIYNEENFKNINKKDLYKRKQLKSTDENEGNPIKKALIDRNEITTTNSARHENKEFDLENNKEFYIKDGNVEILQLSNRINNLESSDINGENNYANIDHGSLNPQLMILDNTGKEILMRRFIEEQPNGKQIIREHYQVVSGANIIHNMPNQIPRNKGDSTIIEKSAPNSVVYSQNEPEVRVIHTQNSHGEMGLQTNLFPETRSLNNSNKALTEQLEMSLKHQNFLLSKILLEREKQNNTYGHHDIALETQSLPGRPIAMVKQTECEVATQTDIRCTDKKHILNDYFIRKARSENDDSYSEDSYEYVNLILPQKPSEVCFVKRKKTKKRNKYKADKAPKSRIVLVEEVYKNLRTPIKEESDESNQIKKTSPPQKPMRDTKTNILRRKKNEEKMYKNEKKTDLQSNNNSNNISDSMYEELTSEERRKSRRYKSKQLTNNEKYDSSCHEGSYSKNNQNHILGGVSVKNNSEILVSGSGKKHFKIHFSNPDESNYPKEDIYSSSEPVANKHKPLYVQNDAVLTGKTDADLHRKQTFREDNLSDVITSSDLNSGTNAKYMDWYYEKKNISRNSGVEIQKFPSERLVSKTHVNKSTEEKTKKEDQGATSGTASVFLKGDIEFKNEYNTKDDTNISHPLLQHSEHRFERENNAEGRAPPTNVPLYIYSELLPDVNKTTHSSKSQLNQSTVKENAAQNVKNKINVYIDDGKLSSHLTSNPAKQLNASTLEDDHDSGIVMNTLLNSMNRRNPIAEKKSVFTIAYDDISRVQKITSGAESPLHS